MARQTGPLKYTGTIGDIRHFKIKGLKGAYAGMIGGPSAEQIATAPEFARTRENMNEFGACALVGKALRVGLASVLSNMSDPQVTGRLTAIMKKINLEDGSEARGQRAVLVSATPQYLVDFEFNRNRSLDGTLNAPYTITASAGRDSSTVAVPVFNPMNLLSIPSGATHFRIINAIAVLSDYVYNADTKTYEPTDPTLDKLNAVAYSDYLPVDALSTVQTIVATLPGTPTLTASASVINAIGIEFYQEVNTNYYVFNQGNAMKIKQVF
jgi:hypothetical protein